MRDEVEREALHDWLENRPPVEHPDGFEVSDVPGVVRRDPGPLVRALERSRAEIREELGGGRCDLP